MFALRFLFYALALLGLLLYLARGFGLATPTIPSSSISATTATTRISEPTHLFLTRHHAGRGGIGVLCHASHYDGGH